MHGTVPTSLATTPRAAEMGTMQDVLAPRRWRQNRTQRCSENNSLCGQIGRNRNVLRAPLPKTEWPFCCPLPPPSPTLRTTSRNLQMWDLGGSGRRSASPHILTS